MTDRASFREFAKRLDAESPSRYPLFWDLRAAELMKRDYAVYFGSGRTVGFFRPHTGMGGGGGASLRFYDDPAWITEMMEYYADYLIRLTTPMLRDVVPDCVHFFEDMAYRGGPLISPEFFRSFMMKPYRRVIDHFRTHGVPFCALDCDGNIHELIPLFLELGIDAVYPLEVQAGMDILALRKKYGRDLVLWGGIDKRKLALDKKDIEAEVYAKSRRCWNWGDTFRPSTMRPRRIFRSTISVIIDDWSERYAREGDPWNQRGADGSNMRPSSTASTRRACGRFVGVAFEVGHDGAEVAEVPFHPVPDMEAQQG